MHKLVLVTGGSGSLGAAISKRLAKDGYEICIQYFNNQNSAQNILEEIVSENGAAFIYKADLSKSKDIEKLFLKIKERKSILYALVNNAAILYEKPIILTNDTFVKKMINVNVYAVYKCTRLAAKMMMKQNKGIVINVGSLSIYNPLFGQSAYSMSKSCLIGLTKATALELSGYNVRVNLIVPGPVAGGMYENKSQGNKESLIPLKNIPKPVDIANVIAFLCSEQSSHITGQTIIIDDGLSLTTSATKNNRFFTK